MFDVAIASGVAKSIEGLKAEVVRATCLGGHPTLLTKVIAALGVEASDNIVGRGETRILPIQKL